MWMSASWAKLLGVIFARDADPRVKDALQPLLDHREEEVGELLRL
jgi:hypothetical protein